MSNYQRLSWVVGVGCVIKGKFKTSLWWWNCSASWRCTIASLMVRLLHCSLVRCHYWGKLTKSYTGSIYIISHNCTWIYNKKNLIENKEITEKRNVSSYQGYTLNQNLCGWDGVLALIFKFSSWFQCATKFEIQYLSQLCGAWSLGVEAMER